MENPYLEVAARLSKKLSNQVVFPSMLIEEHKAQALLAIAFEMNRFNNMQEKEIKEKTDEPR